MNTGTDPVMSGNGLLTTIAASTDPAKVEYALEGSIFVAGAANQWLRDGMRLVENTPETEMYASQVEDTDGVYIVPAFAGMGAPYWNQYARGTVVGLTRGCTREHFIRATLESIAYQAYDVIKAMEEDAGLPINIGTYLISFGLIFFAFTTILGWNYYGERCILYLTGTTKSIKPFKIIYILAIAIAPFMTLDPIWMLADITNALMGIPNLIALLGLRKVVISETKKYFQAKETVVAAEGIQELS